MAGPQFKERMRRKILKDRGLERAGHGRLAVADSPIIPGRQARPGHTLAMRILEATFELPIEDLLMTGSLEQVADMLGIDQSTVSKWRLRLGLRT